MILAAGVLLCALCVCSLGSCEFNNSNFEAEIEVSLAPTNVQIIEQSGFEASFVRTFPVILISEIGDNTFFIAAVMAMKYPRAVVFFGSIAALITMTFVSVLCGWAFSVIPHVYTFYGSVMLFLIFGTKMIFEGLQASADSVTDEYKEMQLELRKNGKDIEMAGFWKENTYQDRNFCQILAQAFMLTFLGEWGDRSQIATMVLAFDDNKIGIVLASFIGHLMSTGVAVIGGKLIARKISIRTVSLIGGVIFIISAIITFLKYNVT